MPRQYGQVANCPMALRSPVPRAASSTSPEPPGFSKRTTERAAVESLGLGSARGWPFASPIPEAKDRSWKPLPWPPIESGKKENRESRVEGANERDVIAHRRVLLGGIDLVAGFLLGHNLESQATGLSAVWQLDRSPSGLPNEWLRERDRDSFPRRRSLAAFRIARHRPSDIPQRYEPPPSLGTFRMGSARPFFDRPRAARPRDGG